jgi:putative protease
VKNKFLVGDQIEVIHPSGNHTVTLEHMRNLDGEPIAVAPGSPLQVRIPLEARYSGALLARLIPA